MMDEKHGQLATVISNLLAASGKRVNEALIPSVESVYEPLVTSASPEDWVAGLALHVGDSVCACEQLTSLMDQLLQRMKQGRLEPMDTEVVDGIWDITTSELHYHVSAFPPYANIIREIILQELQDEDISVLVPPCDHNPEVMLPVQQTVEMLTTQGQMDAETASWVLKTLARLYSCCKMVATVVSEFTSEPEANLDVLILRFVKLHSSFLEMGSLLLEADVAAVLLFRHLSLGVSDEG